MEEQAMDLTLEADGAGETQEQPEAKLIFGVDDKPPIHIALFYALQVALSIIAGPMTCSLIIHRQLCAEGDNKFLGELMSASLFNAGVCTIIQVILGVRLPVLQASSMLYLLGNQALMSTDEWRCPENLLQGNVSSTNSSDNTDGSIDLSEIWRPRLQILSGGIVVGSVFHFLMGALGVVGFLSRYVGPLPVASVMGLIGISLYDMINIASRPSFPVAMFTVVMYIIFGIVLGDKMVPVPICDQRRKCKTTSYPMFKIFASNLAIIAGWLLCLILTLTGVFSASRGEVGYYARTDTKLSAIYSAKWFYIPYPGHWGAPEIVLINGIAYIPVAMSSIMESIGDYIATAHVCEQPRPPVHAINRGIAIEGVGSVFSALTGICHGTTSWSNMIGLIGYTGVGSRYVWILAGLICLFGGVIGKLGAVLAIVPDPIIGGIYTAALGMIFSSAITMLHPVDMTSSRNQIVLGLAFVLGVSLPIYMREHGDEINSGNVVMDRILFMCVSNGMIIGGVVSFALDNILPGTLETRGMKIPPNISIGTDASLYEIPYTAKLRGFPLFRFIPCLPCFDDRPCRCCRIRCGKCRRNGDAEKHRDKYLQSSF